MHHTECLLSIAFEIVTFSAGRNKTAVFVAEIQFSKNLHGEKNLTAYILKAVRKLNFFKR